jgi:hypothetical protein
MKASKIRLSKEVQDLKATAQATTIDFSSKKAMEVDDLEKSEHNSTAAASLGQT